MALVKTISKSAVTKIDEGLYGISVKLLLEDASVSVIDQDFTAKYKTGDDPLAVIKGLREQIQDAIDAYKEEQVLYNHQKFTDGVAWLISNVGV